MAHDEATQKLVSDFERELEIVEIMTEATGSRATAIKEIVARTAPSFILSNEFKRPGQVAQGLTEWHEELEAQCSREYKRLTLDPEGPQLSREEANTETDLQTLQAIRRGVKLARNTNNRAAKGSSQR